MPTDHPLFVIFFMLGAIVFFVGIALRILLYWRGQWDFWSLVKGAFWTVFSAKILKLIEIVFLDGVLQRRLFGQEECGRAQGRRYEVEMSSKNPRWTV